MGPLPWPDERPAVGCDHAGFRRRGQAAS